MYHCGAVILPFRLAGGGGGGGGGGGRSRARDRRSRNLMVKDYGIFFFNKADLMTNEKEGERSKERWTLVQL